MDIIRTTWDCTDDEDRRALEAAATKAALDEAKRLAKEAAKANKGTKDEKGKKDEKKKDDPKKDDKGKGKRKGQGSVQGYDR